eukprot:Colp12_sorted_trinity150504_noHs@833
MEQEPDYDTTTGVDTEGGDYNDISEMWDKEVKTGDPNKIWYGAANKYWEKVPTTINGMLGGFGYVSSIDVEASRDFIANFLPGGKMARTEAKRALDCGAGIGRVTKKFLLPIFDRVDLVEQCPNFVEKAKTYVESDRVENFFCTGLQNFTPEPARYNVIWCQWVLGHLTDDDLVAFFQRVKQGLVPGGLICVKENNTKQGFMLDKDDHSVTRSDSMLKAIFERAGLKLLLDEVQPKFPKQLFPVKMYALE